MRRPNDLPIVLVNWYDATKWILERVDNFPKNQRFIFGQRLADRALTVLELLVETAYSRNKQRLLERANREIEVLRWLTRMSMDRGLLGKQQYLHFCGLLAECGSIRSSARAVQHHPLRGSAAHRRGSSEAGRSHDQREVLRAAIGADVCRLPEDLGRRLGRTSAESSGK